MPLISISGDRKKVNRKLLMHAFQDSPSLILDCGNSADPHSLFPRIREEQLHNVYVMNAEAIYRFRDSLKETEHWMKKLKLRCLVITTIHTLFSYDNPEENHNVLEHCWELMKDISNRYPVLVGIAKDPMHIEFADRFSDKVIDTEEVI